MGASMWYGGGDWKNSNGQPNGGVLVGVHRRWSRAVIGTAHRGGRVQFVVLRGQLGRRIIFGSVYAPTEVASDAEKDAFWSNVADALEELKPTGRDLLLMPGDYNGETGRTTLGTSDRSGDMMMSRSPTGPWGCGTANTNGQRLLEECSRRRWLLAETFIARPPRQMWSFRGSFPVGEGLRSHREYDHFVCSENLKGKFQDVRNVWRTRHESDHCLRVMELRLGGNEFATAKQKDNVGRALRRVDVGEAVGVALRKAMPDMCGDDARAPQAGGNRSTPKPRGRRSVTNAATSASAINNKVRAASGAETSAAEDMDLHTTWKPSRRWHTRWQEEWESHLRSDIKA